MNLCNNEINIAERCLNLADLLSESRHAPLNQAFDFKLDNAASDFAANGHLGVFHPRTHIRQYSLEITLQQDLCFSRSVPPGICLMYCLEGKWCDRVNGKEFDLTPLNSPTILGSEDTVEMTTDEVRGSHIKVVSLYIQKDFFEQDYHKKSQIDPSLLALSDWMTKDVTCKKLLDCPQLDGILKRLADNPYQGMMAEIHRDSLSFEALLSLANHARQETSIPPSHYMEDFELAHEAQKLLVQSLINRPNVSDLAGHLGTNETKLRRAFKSTYGKSIIDYIVGIRLEAAQIMLKEKRFSVNEIAYRVGYSNSSNFSNAYKRHFGYAPKFEN